MFKFNSIMLLAAAAALVCAAGSTPAKAATITFTDQAQFLSQLGPGYYLETFDSLQPGPNGVSQSFSSGGFGYTATAPNQLWVDYINSDKSLGANRYTDTLTIQFTSGNVTAVGGNFFATTVMDWVVTAPIRVELNDGSVVAIPNSSYSTFIGFVTDGTPITSLAFSTTEPNYWPNLDNLYVGAAAPGAVPEPSSMILITSGALFVGLASRLRKHAKV